MGLLDKIGRALVEEIPTTKEVQLEEFNTDIYTEDVDANIEGVGLESLVDDVYANNNLFDTTHSIFKVEELIKSLPKEMVTETKRDSVLAILSSFGLTSMEVIEDGDKRIGILQGALEKITAECTQTIDKDKEHIEELKKQIATLEGEISDNLEQIKTAREFITKETERVKSLIGFIEGGSN